MGTGILHPKLRNQFSVIFSCEVDDSALAEQMAAALSTLSNQVITAELPPRVFGTTVMPRFNKTMKDIATKGDLIVMFEDDVSGQLSSAIEMVADHAMYLEIRVAKLSNEIVLESHLFGRAMIDSMRESVLDYGGGYERFEGLITDTKTGLQSYLSFSKAGVSSATIKKTLAFKFAYAQLFLKDVT